MQEALRQLWLAVFPGSPFPDGVKSEQWKAMGWQSDLPTRDIRQVENAAPFAVTLIGLRLQLLAQRCSPAPRCYRGGGLLSLEALVWMAQRQHDTFSGLMEKRAGVRSSWEYPFAAAGVNVAFMLVQVTARCRPATHRACHMPACWQLSSASSSCVLRGGVQVLSRPRCPAGRCWSCTTSRPAWMARASRPAALRHVDL